MNSICVLVITLSILSNFSGVDSFNHSPRIPSKVSAFKLNSTLKGNAPQTSERVQRLKDASLQKEILKDVTASEFALKLDINQKNRVIDYDMLISNLERDISLLKFRQKDRSKSLLDRLEETKRALLQIKDKIVTSDQSNLITTITTSTESDSNTATHSDTVAATAAATTTSSNVKSTNLAKDKTTTITTSSSSSEMSLKDLRDNLSLIVREDGTVDWNEAIASSKEVAKFGTELWERINGKEEGIPSLSELFGQLQSKVTETDEIKRLNDIVLMAQKEYDDLSIQKEQLKSILREYRRNGETIATEDIQKLQYLELQSKELEKRVKVFTLNYDIECICVYLYQEIESSIVSSPDTFDQRALIAQIALIDKQLLSIMTGMKLPTGTISSSLDVNNMKSTTTTSSISSSTSGSSNSGSSSSSSTGSSPLTSLNNELISLIDEDELTIICNEVNELKGQLGLGPQAGGIVDWGSVGVVASESANKIKEGLSFYGEGTKLFLNDVQYAWYLFTKAIQGYTLKPREVNSLRRTGKDMLTLIPFTIILIIPLTPIGHVLVFSFIQRFFPDFYPSCYTEKRINLGKLLSEIEQKNVDDLIGQDEPKPFFQSLNMDQKWTNFITTIKNVFKQVISNESNVVTLTNMDDTKENKK